MKDHILKEKRFAFLYIGIIVLIFLARILLFANFFGGVEHDSGWYLGVAKNLAKRGIYASYTNTIREEGMGPHASIHGRFSVQDSAGFSYFPAGVTVGPGYVVPEALILKLFGDGFWQYRLWPLLGFAGLLFILFFLTLRIGGFISLVIFQFWLWSIPQLTTTYAYESYSEHIALFYLLISFLFYYFALHRQKQHLIIFVSGLFLSFSVLTKNLFFLAGISFIFPFMADALINRKKIRALVLKWGLFMGGFILPIVFFEVYRYLFLVSNFGYSSWVAINQDILLTFQSGGSGISNLALNKIDWAFVIKKINIWNDVGINNPLFAWLIILIAPVVLIPNIQKRFRIIFVLIYASIVISFIWFIFISQAGWARHAWQGIVLGMLIISASLGYIFRRILKDFKNGNRIFFLILIMIFISGVIRYESFEIKPFIDQSTVKKWQINRYTRGLEGFPSTPILALNDQKKLINYFKKNIQEKDRVYYAGWFIHAEVSPLVDKVFYTLDRYFFLNQKNPEGGTSYVIFGPYQQGQWSFMPPDYLPRKIDELCEKTVFKNNSYALCTLRKGIVYNNPAYN